MDPGAVVIQVWVRVADEGGSPMEGTSNGGEDGRGWVSRTDMPLCPSGELSFTATRCAVSTDSPHHTFTDPPLHLRCVCSAHPSVRTRAFLAEHRLDYLCFHASGDGHSHPLHAARLRALDIEALARQRYSQCFARGGRSPNSSPFKSFAQVRGAAPHQCTAAGHRRSQRCPC